MSCDTLLVHGHYGLGDHLLLNGMYRWFLKQGRPIAIPTHAHNIASVRDMLLDFAEHVEVFDAQQLDTCKGEFKHTLSLGYYGHGFDPSQFDRSFYQQARVPFVEKWHGFRLPFPSDRPYPLLPRFVHDDASRGFVIPMTGHRPERTVSVFDHLQDLNGSEEVHAINSCFAILADLTAHPGDLFLHLSSRQDGGVPPIMGQHWERR